MPMASRRGAFSRKISAGAGFSCGWRRRWEALMARAGKEEGTPVFCRRQAWCAGADGSKTADAVERQYCG